MQDVTKLNNADLAALCAHGTAKKTAYELAAWHNPGETRKAAAARILALLVAAEREQSRRHTVRCTRHQHRRPLNTGTPGAWRPVASVVLRFVADSGSANCRDTVRCGDVPGVTVEQWADWDVYSKGWHRQHGAATITHRVWTVPEDWRRRVGMRGLRRVDGLLTLDARRDYSDWGAATVYRAVWVEQGRGNNVRAVSGWIALLPGGVSYHSTTSAAHAVQQAGRKARAASSPGARATLESLIARLWRHGGVDAALAGVSVTIRDSVRAGNCETGTRQFAARLGYDLSRETETTLGDLWRRIGQVRVTDRDMGLLQQAGMAALCAIRRARRSRLLVA